MAKLKQKKNFHRGSSFRALAVVEEMVEHHLTIRYQEVETVQLMQQHR